MKSKNFIIFLIILIILVMAVFAKNALKEQTPTEEPWADIIQFPVNKDAISECIINYEGKTLRLAKKDDQWVLANQQEVYVVQQKLDSLLARLDNMTGELRSTDQSLLADYEIDDSKGVHITIKNDVQGIAALIIGTKTSGGNNNFVRTKDSSAVYLTEENILAELGIFQNINTEKFDIDPWVDKKIVHFNKDNVTKITLNQEGKAFCELIKNNNTWKTVKSFSKNIDQNKITTFIRALTNLKAHSIASAEENGEFEISKWNMTIGLNDNTNITFTLGRREGNNYFLQASDKEYSFKIPDYTFNNINKTDGDFFVDNPFAINPDSVTAININDIENNQELTAVKSIEEDEQASDSLWKSLSGDNYETNNIRNLINKLKDIPIKTLPEDIAPSDENALIISITVDDKSYDYTFSKSITINEHLNAHYLKAAGDDQSYFIENKIMTDFKAAIKKIQTP